MTIQAFHTTASQRTINRSTLVEALALLVDERSKVQVELDALNLARHTDSQDRANQAEEVYQTLSGLLREYNATISSLQAVLHTHRQREAALARLGQKFE